MTPAAHHPRGLSSHLPRHKHFGAAVSLTHLSEPRCAAWLTHNCSTITPENALKLSELLRSDGRYHWHDADRIADFARAHSLRMRGHTLVWHEQLPPQFHAQDRSATEWTRVLRAHIREVVLRYRDVVDEWDVVNEAVGDDGAVREDSFWYQAIGMDYISVAFEEARKYTDAKLYYNDYGIEHPNPKSNTVLELLASLRARGVPVHGVGFQCHFLAYSVDALQLRENVRRFHAAGLAVSFTEVDVCPKVRRDPEFPNAQLEVYRVLAREFVRSSATVSFTTWGVDDARSWVPAKSREQLGEPLLVDAEFRNKPAYEVVREAFGGWGDGDGLGAFRP